MCLNFVGQPYLFAIFRRKEKKCEEFLEINNILKKKRDEEL